MLPGMNVYDGAIQNMASPLSPLTEGESVESKQQNLLLGAIESSMNGIFPLHAVEVWTQSGGSSGETRHAFGVSKDPMFAQWVSSADLAEGRTSGQSLASRVVASQGEPPEKDSPKQRRLWHSTFSRVLSSSERGKL